MADDPNILDDSAEAWHLLSAGQLGTGWDQAGDLGVSNVRTPRYYLDGAGVVWMDVAGAINGSYGGGFSFPLFTLPVGYRPDVAVVRSAVWSDFATGVSTGLVMVLTTGAVHAPLPPANNAHVNLLTGLSFRAA